MQGTTMTVGQRILRLVNLRPEESERTFLMFVAYTATSIGILWLEMSSAALFLTSYGAEFLPWIYIASAAIGLGLNSIYSVLQRLLPLRHVIVLIAVLMALPLLVFRVGLAIPALYTITIFIMRLWNEAIFALNEVNTSVTANQIFNIREIKRTYPLISSGNLVSDVISGFSLPLMLALLGIENILVLACLVMLLGSGMLFYLSRTYQQAFPDFVRQREQKEPIRHSERTDSAAQRLRGSLLQYIVLLFCFFVLAQVMYLLIDFQYLSQLELNLDLNAIAGFLGLFSGILGLVELFTQWFVSSRAIERMGIFFIASLLPIMAALLALLPLFNIVSLLIGLVVLKFVDELLRYTLQASTTPILFQPVPNRVQSRIQSLVRGLAEPLSMVITGVGILLVIAGLRPFVSAVAGSETLQSKVFVVSIMLVAMIWLGVIYLLRSRYLNLLVVSADRGELSTADGNLRAMRQAMLDAIGRPGSETDRASYLDLLASLDPEGVAEALAPLLSTLPPALQCKSLTIMLEHSNSDHLSPVRSLISDHQAPEVLALALRYVWITESNSNQGADTRMLMDYLQPSVDPVVRGTAAALILRNGSIREQEVALTTIQQMLIDSRERERIMGCQAMGDAGAMDTQQLSTQRSETPRTGIQRFSTLADLDIVPNVANRSFYESEFSIYIRGLLQDESLLVRQEALNAIAAMRLKEYYPSLLRGLHYKSTREAAERALSRLGNEAIPMLVRLAEDPTKPEMVCFHAWSAIGKIDTEPALDAMVLPLRTIWGNRRRTLLRALLRMPQDKGVEAVLERIGRSGVELMLDQELMFVGQIIAALQDLRADMVATEEAELLRRGLQDLQIDGIERIFLLMRFLYDADAMQAAEFSILRSGSFNSMARGLEIVDNTLDIPSKRALLTVLDQTSLENKLQSLSDLIVYYPLLPSDRLRFLLDLRHFLSDWVVACCFYLARQQRWSITPEQILICLRHATGFVREAVLDYLKMASPRSLKELLPLMQNDPNPLVVDQVQKLRQELQQG